MEYRVYVRSVVYNYVLLDADSAEEAEEKVNDMIGEIDLLEGDIHEQEVERVIQV